MSMVGEVCARIHNYFEENPTTGGRMIYQGHYRIEKGVISLSFLAPGQYFRLFGSRFNDGVHMYGVDALTDEEFDGVVWEMRPPREFLDLCDEIQAWQDQYGGDAAKPYQSESVIGVYTYTQPKDGPITWWQVFQPRLKPYMRLPY